MTTHTQNFKTRLNPWGLSLGIFPGDYLIKTINPRK